MRGAKWGPAGLVRLEGPLWTLRHQHRRSAIQESPTHAAPKVEQRRPRSQPLAQPQRSAVVASPAAAVEDSPAALCRR